MGMNGKGSAVVTTMSAPENINSRAGWPMLLYSTDHMEWTHPGGKDTLWEDPVKVVIAAPKVYDKSAVVGEEVPMEPESSIVTVPRHPCENKVDHVATEAGTGGCPDVINAATFAALATMNAVTDYT